MKREADEESAASKLLTAELEWIRSTPKAKGNKSKARLTRYEDLLTASAPQDLRTRGEIFIPAGPR